MVPFCRRRENDFNETANDFVKPSCQSENDDKSELINDDAEVSKAPTENVWAQRSAAKAVASVPADDNAENASSSVMVSFTFKSTCLIFLIPRTQSLVFVFVPLNEHRP